MKKLIFLLLIITAAFQVKAQFSQITIPVYRLETTHDTTFVFSPTKLTLRPIGGSLIGHINMYYEETDSVADNTQHFTPDGIPYSREFLQRGNIQLQWSVVASAFTNGFTTPYVPAINMILGFLNMAVDTTRQINIQ